MAALEKNLGTLDVYALATGATLSSGFFLLPGLAAVEAGPALVLAYVVAAVPLVPAILSKVELMTAMPRAGGIYYFLDRSLGPVTGTIGGIGVWLVLILKVAFALVGMGAYLTLFLPELPIVPVAVGLAVAAGIVNLVGANLSGGVQIALLAGILSILALFVGVGSLQADPAHFRGFFSEGTGSLLSTAGLVYISYAGLTKVAGIAEEVKDPERTLPLSVFLALATALVVYAAGTAVIVGVVPMDELAGDLTSAATAGEAVFGPAGLVLLSGAALLAFAAVTNAGTMSASRFPLAMSRDRIMPRFLQRLNRRGMPTRSILLTVAVIAAVVVFLEPMKIAKLASAFQLLVFSFLCLAVIVMRESRIEEYDPGYLSPFYPWTQIVGILAPLVLIAVMGWWPVLFSAGLVVAGGIWYRIYVRPRVRRRGAVLHLFERLGRRRHEGLERELRQILKEKGLREADPYAEMVGRADVIELYGEVSFREMISRAVDRLARSVPLAPDRLAATFLEETEVGVMPISHGAALPHLRTGTIDRPRLLLVRSRDGIRIETSAQEEVLEGAEEATPGFGEEPGHPSDAPDGEVRTSDAGEPLVHAVFFLVSPEGDARQHLRMLASLAELVERDGFLDRWRRAESERELKEVLLDEERFLSLRLDPAGRAADLVGRELRATPVGEGVRSGHLVALVRRGDEVIDADERTVLREGDRLTVLGDPATISRLRERYGAG